MQAWPSGRATGRVGLGNCPQAGDAACLQRVADASAGISRPVAGEARESMSDVNEVQDGPVAVGRPLLTDEAILPVVP